MAQARTARLATRDPSRLERQIFDLKALEASSLNGLKPKETKQLEELERDVARVRKAKDSLGVNEQHRPRGGRRDGGSSNIGGRGGSSTILGKRPRGWDRDDESTDTDPEVRNIPMPRDTPPPIPRPRNREPHTRPENANFEPLGDKARISHGLPSRPDAASPSVITSGSTLVPRIKKTYEAAPQIRDLRKEAIKIVPSSVRQKMEASKGQGPGGKLLEEEDMERLEAEGYGARAKRKSEDGRELRIRDDSAEEITQTTNQGGKPEDESGGIQAGPGALSMEEEEARFAREVQMEEITDEDA